MGASPDDPGSQIRAKGCCSRLSGERTDEADGVQAAPQTWWGEAHGQARRRARQQLAGLSDQMLQDLGITRTDVEREYGKPFWRA